MVAPVAASVATVAVGATGIVATYKAGARQRQTALAVTRQQADAQAAVAREERPQRRLEAAYIGMLAAVTNVFYWTHNVYPLLTRTAEEFTMPPIPDLPDIATSEALWTAYWSPRVEQLMNEWQATVLKLQSAGIQIGMGRSAEASGQTSGIDWAARLSDLPDLKQAVFAADKSVRDQVRLEFLGRHDGHAEVAVPSHDSGGNG
jgi:hypothetical protein